jgi:hypothetical protein
MAIATTMPPGRYGARHIDRWSVSVASCEATKFRHRACARAVSARRTPWSSPSPLVKTQHKTQLLASVYRTFLLAKLLIFITRKGPSTHVIDATSFIKTCQQEKKGGSHQLHFQLSNVDSGQKFENLLSSHEAQKKVAPYMGP